MSDRRYNNDYFPDVRITSAHLEQFRMARSSQEAEQQPDSDVPIPQATEYPVPPEQAYYYDDQPTQPVGYPEQSELPEDDTPSPAYVSDSFSDIDENTPETGADASGTANRSGNASDSLNKQPSGSAGIIVVAVFMMIIGILTIYIMAAGKPDSVQDARSGDDRSSSASYSESRDTENTSDDTIDSSETEIEENIPDSSLLPLEYGSNSEDVKKMQIRLMKLGYMGRQSCTGYYGEYTLKAIKAFQQKAGLPVTGSADVETLRLLYSDNAPPKR